MTTPIHNELLQQLHNGLVVSCQSLPASPMDRTDIVAAMAQAAVLGGACAVRIEGMQNVRAVAARVAVPIVGIVKRDLPNSAVRITPWVQDVMDLAEAGANIIAFDATDRTRPASTKDLYQAILDTGCLAMADCATLGDALSAWSMGCHLVGTTMSGYTQETLTPSEDPDFALLSDLAQRGVRVVAEGRFRTPEQAARALRLGAYCVTVGSAITRIEHITQWFTTAMAGARP